MSVAQRALKERGTSSLFSSTESSPFPGRRNLGRQIRLSVGSPSLLVMDATRDAQAAKRYLTKALRVSHTMTHRLITLDKNAVYLKALNELKAAETVSVRCELRQSKYLIEQDHRFLKRLTKPRMGFFSFETAQRTLHG